MNLAYVDFVETKDGYRAGLLITDQFTKPLEFRVTTNLKIDELQKILYGDLLENVLYKEKFTIELVKKAQEDFDVLLVKEKELISLRDEIGKPIGFLRKFDPFKAMDRYSHKIISITDKYEPLTITLSKEDFKLVIPISKKLQEMYKNYNIMEPFNRIRKAIEFLSNTQ